MPKSRYPRAIKPDRVGSYPALAKSGGGHFWDDVLEYRVWCHPERGAPDHHDGSDYFLAFRSYPEALGFSRKTPGAENPLVLIRQREWVDEPVPGKYIRMKKIRLTEWKAEWLKGAKRSKPAVEALLGSGAPNNALKGRRAKRARP